MISLLVCLTGLTPLMMHNVRLANPLDPAAKALGAVTSKRKKTDADHLEISWLEWLGGLYLHPDTGVPSIPGENLRAAWVGGAKKLKLGKDVACSLLCPEAYPLVGPGCGRDLRAKGTARALFDEGPFVDVRAVGNRGNRVMRSRPIFRQWSLTAEVQIDEEIVNKEQALQALNKAGAQVGLGDFRVETGGNFGKFLVEAA